MASITDILKGVVQGGAQALPGAITQANEFEVQARTLAARDKANQIQQQSVEGLNKLREQQKDMNDLNLVVNAHKAPKATQSAMFKFLVKNNVVSQDYADLALKAPDETLAEVERMLADKEISVQDLVKFKQMGMADLIPAITKIEQNRVDRGSERATVSQIKQAAQPTQPAAQPPTAGVSGVSRLGKLQEQFLIQGKEKAAGRVADIIKLRSGGTGNIPTEIRSFEVVSGIDPSLRGTKDYRKAFSSFQQETGKRGRQQIVGSTPEGQLITFNTADGSIETRDVASEILPKNKKLLSGEVAGQLGVFDSLINQIKDIRVLSARSPELIGAVEGRWNKLKSRFVDNRDFTELDRNVESLITIAYALSGKQISEREMRMLKGAILPSVTQPDANFEVALDFAEKWLTTNRDNRIKRLKASGFFVGDIKAKTKAVQPPSGQSDIQAVTNFINKKR